MPDEKRAKPLSYKEKSECKVSKALKDIEVQGLTYPQMPENTGRPASVAITSLASSICRVIYQAHLEPTMTAEPTLEAK